MNYEITITSENTKFFPMHSHDMWEFMCYIKGNGRLRTEKGDYPFSKGTVIAIPPGIEHGSVSDDNFTNICIHTKAAFCEKSIIYIKQANVQQIQLFEMINSFYFCNEEYEAVVINLISALVNLIEISCKTTKFNSGLKYVYDRISEKFTDIDFDLNNLIENSGYVVAYFRNIFKKEYGFTPKEYLDRLRLEYAAGLIKTYGKSLKIYEIAAWCGFNDPLYFSRKFKKYFGKSPVQYLKSSIKSE